MTTYHKDGWLFLRKWLRDPMKIAAPWPSSKYLADAMCTLVNGSCNGVVLELGAGTGAVTRALLNQGVAQERLYIIERDRILARMLSQYYPDATVIEGDAGQLDRLLGERGVTQVNAVVSSLPMLVIPQRIQLAILKKSFSLLAPDGVFVQYTYGTRSPIGNQVCERVGITGVESKSVWRNLPPAKIWSYRQSNAPAPMASGLS